MNLSFVLLIVRSLFKSGIIHTDCEQHFACKTLLFYVRADVAFPLQDEGTYCIYFATSGGFRPGFPPHDAVLYVNA